MAKFLSAKSFCRWTLSLVILTIDQNDVSRCSKMFSSVGKWNCYIDRINTEEPWFGVESLFCQFPYIRNYDIWMESANCIILSKQFSHVLCNFEQVSWNLFFIESEFLSSAIQYTSNEHFNANITIYNINSFNQIHYYYCSYWIDSNTVFALLHQQRNDINQWYVR